jgi:LysM repeat protein
MTSPPSKPSVTQETPQKPSQKQPELAPLTVPEPEKQPITSPVPTQSSAEPVEDKREKEEPVAQQETAGKPAPTGEIIIYTVKYGDTLESIARDMRVSKEEIIQLNNLKKPYLLPAGRKLKVPYVPKVSFKD